MDSLRKRGENKEPVRPEADPSQPGTDEARRQLRRKMRVYPNAPGGAEPLPDAKQREREDAERKAIVSVNGEDVDVAELDPKRRRVA